ncbi:ferrochelatase [Shewanella oneidensis MR-1]|uniref:Ferrochelatase 2 n=1 Tax=Shewanella oneidensis (strain ATCC 700550 / JCM 31522 / CIP 106686 / LMG 19005 / NCIMB 14063 / MR-1) TaxID=211586 RepID=HEMH2_SHEON|nr:ferrochelatase [Shewanella oneidensis]Q8EBZ7.1 RecName: Full=Ferrochelatase 2; AltName: Full=Heme synthase 2; AltName: Full=Protoheme ferro-lyase 2 [Shewanella oneidensis MR-1]AAN56346.1 ferrochelatase HemH [Shewanella oneidensis MR-1]MDX5999234.1 ferrochelatase [Shewanella oneidensis]QKG97752.1 ferrochelatase [Shewanella oneidensis MR-1]
MGHAARGKVGVLLLNLGTPDAPTASAVRRYLAEFLSDPRVVEIPKLLWMLILYGIVLRVRPAKSAALYQKVWTEAGSPLMDISLRQTAKLSDKLTADGHQVSVHLAMRYGNPSVASTLREMHKQGIDKLVVLPLYPQYAAPTTGSAFDAIAKELSQWRYLPSLHFINTYHDNPDFIAALVNSIRDDFDKHGKPQKLVLSYHGMPERNLHLGDPYYCFCMKTTRLVAEQLGLSKDEFAITFQSRFGKAKWLQPYTDATMAALPSQGVRDVAIVCPAFSADCLETLEEIVGENGHIFTHAGGEKFRYIPALNDNDDHIAMMANLVKPYL